MKLPFVKQLICILLIHCCCIKAQDSTKTFGCSIGMLGGFNKNPAGHLAEEPSLYDSQITSFTKNPTAKKLSALYGANLDLQLKCMHTRHQIGTSLISYQSQYRVLESSEDRGMAYSYSENKRIDVNQQVVLCQLYYSMLFIYKKISVGPGLAFNGEIQKSYTASASGTSSGYMAQIGAPGISYNSSYSDMPYQFSKFSPINYGSFFVLTQYEIRKIKSKASLRIDLGPKNSQVFVFAGFHKCFDWSIRY